ncbi:sorbin/SH3 domain protein [Perilla frutescens var. hirtella]|uniref:Sorbin/SH3 domain protein n=1 Tax=Perilla frutescens var. hirtella TaxID=608512 RepID=A0AAD4JKG6_PERFH|nr:sorbin/SH3 domain protein [Perilla frutescens var. hirtella]
MEDRKERNAPWLSVPQFGDWDQKGPLPDYSLDFSKIREMRKQNKKDPSRASLGNEEELIPSTTRESNTAHINDHRDYHQNNSPTLKLEELKKIYGFVLIRDLNDLVFGGKAVYLCGLSQIGWGSFDEYRVAHETVSRKWKVIFGICVVPNNGISPGPHESTGEAEHLPLLQLLREGVIPDG